MAGKGGAPTVLVIEDDAALRQLYRFTLATRGFRVELCGDGLEALASLDGSAPAAVVLDMGLPRLPGREVLAELKGSTRMKNIPVVVVTAYEPIGVPESVKVLRKPVDADLVSDVVTRLVRRHG